MAKTAVEKVVKWRKDPVAFVREVFRAEPDPWQVEALRAVAANQRIAMKSSKGPGKTCLLAWIAWWFLVTRPHPKMAATSITKDNLTDNLWPEMAKWMKKSKFLDSTFEWTKTRIFCKDHPETWWMSARTWPKSADSTQQADTLAGLHADYLMFLLDEVGGIPDAVMAAAEAGLASGIESKIIMAGNPTHLEGPLYRACTSERHLWHVIEITSDPDDPLRSPRVSTQWAKEQIEKYGRDNPWVLVNVFGQFPPASINTLIGPEQVTAAMKRHYLDDVYQWSQKRLGVDVARFGDDRCHDDKTEVLTNKGWMFFKDLSGDEMVLSVKNDLASWEKIDYIHESDWDGEMNLHEKRHLNFCITDNHRMVVRKNTRSKEYTIKPYRDLPKEFIVREENGWSGKNDEFKKFTMKKSMPNGGYQIIEYCFSYLDWAEFVGWFVSEGNVYKEKRDRGRLRIIISQYKGDKRNKLESLMTRMGINWRECSNGNQIEFSNREIGNWLINNCGVLAKNKFIPYEIKNASQEVIDRFLKGFLLGDGTVRKNGLGKQYYTSSKKLADDLQEILIKVGRCGLLKLKEKSGSKFLIGDREVTRKNDTYIVYEKSGNTGKWCKKTNVKKIHYKGKVWCVATKYESFVVRRNGIPMWSGNTCLFPRQGLVAFRPVVMRHERNSAVSVDIANRVMRAKKDWGSEFEAIDDTGGWGKGAVDVLRAAGHDIHAVQFHTKAIDPHYKNIRSEMWDTMCRWIINGGCLPNIPELVNELCAPTYTYVNGQMLLEPKAQIKDRLGSSPDLADALALTFSIPDMAQKDAFAERFGIGGNTHKADYDPFSEERMSS